MAKKPFKKFDYKLSKEKEDEQDALKSRCVKLKELIEFCKKGPMLAHVTDVKISYENYKGDFNDFEVRH